MTKKDYQQIASVLAHRRAKALRIARDKSGNRLERTMAAGQIAAIGDVAEELAFQFRNTNPRFNREKFINACLNQSESV